MASINYLTLRPEQAYKSYDGKVLIRRRLCERGKK